MSARLQPSDPRSTLERRAAELLREIVEADAHRSRPQDTIVDNKEGADWLVYEAIHDAEERRDLHELRAVKAALERLDAGQYGLCTECGERIAQERLAALPAAARCAACQRRVERRPSRA